MLNIQTLQKVPRFTRFAVGLGLKAIRISIKKRANFDIKYLFIPTLSLRRLLFYCPRSLIDLFSYRALEILDLVAKCFIPALFVHSRSDNFVSPMHSELLYPMPANIPIFYFLTHKDSLNMVEIKIEC